MSPPARIGIVGPCKSGKSTLAHNLKQHGYDAHQIAQEHSFAPSMWQKIGRPDLLIYLHCEYPTTVERGLNWNEADYVEEMVRLANARRHADFEISTDEQGPEELLNQVLEFLRSANVAK